MPALPRALLLTALVGVIVACLAALGSSGMSTRQSAVHTMATSALDELSLLAGVASDEGELLREQPMDVEVIADGGPLWVVDSIEQVASASPYFAVGNSPHLLRVEVVEARGGVALQLHLWRSGWELREPEPRHAHIAPWAAVIGGILGALLSLFTRRLSYGIAGAGLVAQLALAIDPLPVELFPPQSLAQAWASGPLISALIATIRQMGTLGLSVVVALLAASLVLVAFDHRRTRGGDDDLGLGLAAIAASLGTMGAIAWVEAASRGSLFAACDLRFGAYFGWLAALGLIVAWLPAIRVAHEAWRARR